MELDVTAEDTQRAYERYTYDMSTTMYGAYHARYEYAARLCRERQLAQLEARVALLGEVLFAARARIVERDSQLSRERARILSLEWKPITKASIVTIAHEVLRTGRTVSISPLHANPSSSSLLKEGYTHYRLINAPKVEVVQ
jgi:hypothetical protein